MSLKNSIIKGIIYSKEYLKNFNLVQAGYEYKKYLSENSQELIRRQKKLKMTFFFNGDNISHDYDSLSEYLYPVNLGWHFSRGTSNIKSVMSQYQDDPLWERMNFIISKVKNNVLFLNFYIDKHNLQYQNIGDIRILFYFQEKQKTQYLCHELFLLYIRKYYTSIFKHLDTIDSILIPGEDFKDIKDNRKAHLKIAIEKIDEDFDEIESYGMHDYDSFGQHYREKSFT